MLARSLCLSLELFRQCSEDHFTHGIFIDVLPCDCVALPPFSLELVEPCHNDVGELEVEYCLMPAHVSALPFRFVLLSEFSPQLNSTVRVHKLDLEDEEELPVALVVPRTEIAMVETPCEILCDVQKLVVHTVNDAKTSFLSSSM